MPQAQAMPATASNAPRDRLPARADPREAATMTDA
jgi:hypothetical protein